MTDTQTTGQARAEANGQHAGPVPDQPCEECATSGEKALAVLAGLIGIFVILMAVDMFTGGAVGRLVPARGGDDSAA